jgi:hypothetical protein
MCFKTSWKLSILAFATVGPIDYLTQEGTRAGASAPARREDLQSVLELPEGAESRLPERLRSLELYSLSQPG